jgi:hypothetical protein
MVQGTRGDCGGVFETGVMQIPIVTPKTNYPKG